jgi:hypothetical protein
MLLFQAQTCTKLVALAQQAAQTAADAAAAAGLGEIAQPASELVLQSCVSWIDDLAVRLAHYSCRYLLHVLAWQSGTALTQVDCTLSPV